MGSDGIPPAQTRLKVMRPEGGNAFRVVGHSALESPPPNTLSTFATRIPVAGGELLGRFHPGPFMGDCASRAASVNYVWGALAGDAPLGTAGVYSSATTLQMNVAVSLEADADGDGFGDETQDACPADPALQAPPCDTTPPETAITEGPRKKTKKKAAEFEFSSSEPGSTFECKLDDNLGFSACSSPQDVKVGRGKHGFQVRATDATGNVDPTPASQTWKVKKKKRK